MPLRFKEELLEWRLVEEYLDWSCPRFKISHIPKLASGNYPKDAFSLGQLATQTWVLGALDHYLSNKGLRNYCTNVVQYGCWFGVSAESYIELLVPAGGRLYGFDSDPEAIRMADEYNKDLVQHNWKFKGVVGDAEVLNSSQLQFLVSGELIRVTPDAIINTSSEHMNENWFETANDDQLIIMTTNDNPYLDGHINTCDTIEHMFDKYPMERLLVTGEMALPTYNRFLQIGYKGRGSN